MGILFWFGVSYILPFFLLTPLWAIAVIIFDLVVPPILSLFYIAILKLFTPHRVINSHWQNFILGTFEAVTIILLSRMSVFPGNFVLAVFAIHIIIEAQNVLLHKRHDEALELAGYSLIVVMFYILKFILIL